MIKFKFRKKIKNYRKLVVQIDEEKQFEKIMDIFLTKQNTIDSIYQSILSDLEDDVCHQYPKARKLSTSWSLEAASDIKAMYGIDLQKEITKILSEEIAEEIDRELMRKLCQK